MRAGLFVGLTVFILACTASGAAGAEAPAGSAPRGSVAAVARPSGPLEGYRVSPGDVVSISVWGEDQLSRECQVNGSGTISYPLLGDVPAAGATCAELQARLQEKLQKYLKRPRVVVTVRHYGTVGMSVFVLGEVKTPGVYPLAGGSGLMQALAAAGGPTPLASGEITIVKARTGEFHTAGLEQATAGAPLASEAELGPGDVILLNRKAEADQDRRYSVLGEVPSPGMFDMPLEGEVRVLDAMEKAGLLRSNPSSSAGARASPSEEQFRTADLEHAVLTRGEAMVPLNLVALLQGDTSQNLLLQPGDVLTVPRRSQVSVYAIGEVRAPGRQMLPPDSSLLDLINAVGGANREAKLSDTTILRLIDGKPRPLRADLAKVLRRADPKQNLTLQEGDVVYVPPKGERRKRSEETWRVLYFIPYLVRL